MCDLVVIGIIAILGVVGIIVLLLLVLLVVVVVAIRVVVAIVDRCVFLCLNGVASVIACIIDIIGIWCCYRS